MISKSSEVKMEIRDNMRISWNVPIEMRDGIILRADVFTPLKEGSYPTILSYGPYAKGQLFQEAYAGQWNVMVRDFPEIMKNTTNKYQNWELTDPERWVPDGYTVVRIDSRGAGCSEGKQYLWSKIEIEDYYECIEWAAEQQWSDGNIGLLGISYYAANQWQVAAMQPPHLKAIIPWEGTSDIYREFYYHGGIRCTFLDSWLPKQLPMQYGYGERARKNPNTGESVAGPVTLSEEELSANRHDLLGDIKSNPFDDEYYRDMKVDWSKVTVPILSSANWGGQGLHLRGNIEGFLQAASEHKWLEVHGLEHWTHFYTSYGVSLQKRFFDYFLKGEDNGWDKEPPVLLQIRQIHNQFKERKEKSWPLPNTQWTKYYLDSESNTISTNAVQREGQVSYLSKNENVSFTTGPMIEETEITGPLAAKLFISSTTDDADLFVTLRLYSPDNEEIIFRGAMDAHAPVAQGWLRASHRKLDEEKTLPYRPYHLHLEEEPLIPGEVYEVDVEIWPTSIVVPKGYSLKLTIGGKDYEYEGKIDEESRSYHRYPSKGCGPFLHVPKGDIDRSHEQVTIFTGGKYSSYILLPVISKN